MNIASLPRKRVFPLKTVSANRRVQPAIIRCQFKRPIDFRQAKKSTAKMTEAYAGHEKVSFDIPTTA
jgi:hypothetical protein